MVDNIVEIHKSKRGDQDLPPSPSASHAASVDKELESTTQFRKLSIERLPPIEQVISCGVVPRFVEFLMEEDHPQLQYEAVTNITLERPSHHTCRFREKKMSDHARVVVINHNAVPSFVKLLASPSDDVREVAVRALCTVARDSPQCRDLALLCGALTQLVNQLNEHGPCTLSMVKAAAWTLSSFCRQRPDQVMSALPSLEWLIYSNDEQVLRDSCLALSRLYHDPVIEAGLVPRLAELLGHPSPSVIQTALLSVASVTTEKEEQIQCVIDSGALPLLFKYLTQSYTEEIKINAVLVVQSITTGNSDQIKAVIDANLIPVLVCLSQDAQLHWKEEAAVAIANATIYADFDQIRDLVEQGCIKPLCDLLESTDPTVLLICLDALCNILDVGDMHYAALIDKAGGKENIKKLESHEDSEIFDAAVSIGRCGWFDKTQQRGPQAVCGSLQGTKLGGWSEKVWDILVVNLFKYGERRSQSQSQCVLVFSLLSSFLSLVPESCFCAHDRF